MTFENEYRLLIGGYYGILELDEYPSKEYILKDIEDYIKDFISTYPDDMLDYESVREDVNDTVSLYRKLQDSQIVLRKINGPMELSLLIQEKLRELKKEEKF